MPDRHTYPPSPDFVKKAHVQGLEAYTKLYEQAAADPEAFGNLSLGNLDAQEKDRKVTILFSR